jgi:hypothetical protein
MKTLAVCLIALLASSCQRYLGVTTTNGMDVLVEKNRITVLDSTHGFRSYRYENAYKQYNQRADLYRILKDVGDPVASAATNEPR